MHQWPILNLARNRHAIIHLVNSSWYYEPFMDIVHWWERFYGLCLPHFKFSLKICQYTNIVWFEQAFGKHLS